MSSTKHNSSVAPATPRSFLADWIERNLPKYLAEYSGERAGVPKGEDIPFPAHKVHAAVALLAYGAPKHETLAAIARSARMKSSALLRVWRTEPRFLALYRRAVWECADEYVRQLSQSWDEQRPAPYQEVQMFFGVALQQAILRRLCVDVCHMDSTWTPFGLEPRWVTEMTVVGLPSQPPPSFSADESSLAYLNTLGLLAMFVFRQRTKDPVQAQLMLSLLMEKWVTQRIIKTDVRAAVVSDDKQMALDRIDFVTGTTPLDDVKKLYRRMHPPKTGRSAK